MLEAARAEACAVDAADVVEGFLLEAHGPAPDHREDRDRWEAWLEATSGRALEVLADGALAPGSDGRSAERPSF